MARISSLCLCVVLVCLLGAARGDEKLSVQGVPPVVVKTVPEAGASEVDPALTEIKVTFSKEMADQSWTWSTAAKDSTPQTTGKPHYLDDKRTCVLPVKLKPGTTYGYWLNSQNFHGFQDSSGKAAVPYLLVFETRK